MQYLLYEKFSFKMATLQTSIDNDVNMHFFSRVSSSCITIQDQSKLWGF